MTATQLRCRLRVPFGAARRGVRILGQRCVLGLVFAAGLFAFQARAQTPPSPLTCPAGYEKVSLVIDGAGSPGGGTSTNWGPNGTLSQTYNLTGSKGGKVDLTLTWSNVSSTYVRSWQPQWGTSGSTFDPAVIAAFAGKPPYNQMLASYEMTFSRPVALFRYIVFNVDGNASGPAYCDVYAASGSPTLNKWGTGYNAVSGSTITGVVSSFTPGCPAGACPNAQVTVQYDMTLASRFTGIYSNGSGYGTRSFSDSQYAGFNNYEACLLLPQATLTLQKSVSPTTGTAANTAWTLTATNPSTSAMISGTNGAPSITNASVDPGTYNLTESGGPSGYNASAYSCVKNGGAAVNGNSITLAANDTATCTITNTAQPAKVTLQKTTVDGAGGPFGFALTNTTVTTGTVSTTMPNQPTQVGIYTVSTLGQMVTINENSLPSTNDYVLDTANTSCKDASGNAIGGVSWSGSTLTIPGAAIGPGAAITCTFVNNKNKADLSISKDNGTIQLSSGANTSYTLTIRNGGPSSVVGATVKDSPTGLTCPPPPLTSGSSVMCTGSGCPATAITYGQLLGAGGALGTIPANSNVVLTVACRVN